MIWEEEGHHIFINLENKYKYTFYSSRHLTKPWSRSAASLFQRTQPPISATQGEDLQGKGVGKESPDSSSITMQKFQVPSHGPPYLYLYGGNKVVLKVGEVTAVKEIKLNESTNLQLTHVLMF